jgi:hypothetical protein
MHRTRSLSPLQLLDGCRQIAITYPRGPTEGRRSKAAIPPMLASWPRSKEAARISVTSVRCGCRGPELDLRVI